MRLIDADELINQGYEIVVDGLQYDTCNKSIDIDTVPTAYDIDKVVAELEKESYQEWCDSPKVVELKDAIEIVKQDGVSDDVCKWKYSDSEYYWESSCEHLHIFMSDGPKENEYDFCPYCGKKIKVVE